MTQTAPATGTPGPIGGDTAADDVFVSSGETTPPRGYTLSDAPGPLSTQELADIDAFWRAAN